MQHLPDISKSNSIRTMRWGGTIPPVFIHLSSDVLYYDVVFPASIQVCPSHNSWSLIWIWTIFHRIVALDLRKCHDVIGPYAHNGLNIVWAISFHWKHGLKWYCTELLHWTQESVTTLIQGHWSKVKVILHTLVFYIVRAITFHRVHKLE
jgi:hypothetical protein